MKYEEQEQKLEHFIASGGDLDRFELDGDIIFTSHPQGWVRTNTGAYYHFMIDHDGGWWFKLWFKS